MPSGPTHDKIAVVTSVPLTIGALYIVSRTEAIYLAAMYVFSSLYLSPDLDIQSTPYYRWGWFKWFWWPYQKIIHHRSWLSHSGPISATIRFTYIFIIPAIVLYILELYNILPNYTIPILLFYISMILADIVHTLADVFIKE